MSEKDRVSQEQLDIKCLQLLRGMIHNEIIKLPDEWEANMKANKKWEIKKKYKTRNVISIEISYW